MRRSYERRENIVARRLSSKLLVVIAVTCSVSERSVGQANNLALKWNDAALRGPRDSRLPAPEVARALAVINTCIYDAWVAYDDVAQGTQMEDAIRAPVPERTIKNKEKALS